MDECKMRPCSMTEAENEEIWKKSIFYTESNFSAEYEKHISAMWHISECAKIYITKHWKEIKDWSGIHLVVKNNKPGYNNVTEYYKYVPNERGKDGTPLNRIFKKIDERNKNKHNPMISMDKVVLDPSDGDLSITVNGNEEHWWIDDEAVITIADYIEKELKKE